MSEDTFINHNPILGKTAKVTGHAIWGKCQACGKDTEMMYIITKQQKFHYACNGECSIEMNRKYNKLSKKTT